MWIWKLEKEREIDKAWMESTVPRFLKIRITSLTVVDGRTSHNRDKSISDLNKERRKSNIPENQC